MKYLLPFLLLLSFNVFAADASISWVAPVEREDGTAFAENEIKEFRVYYGAATGDYQNTVVVERPDAASPTPVTATLSLLAGSAYYIVVTAVDIEGRESMYSNEYVFNPPKPPVLCTPNPDLNCDGTVNAGDLAILKIHFFSSQ